MRTRLSDLYIKGNFEYCSDGQMAIDTCRQLIEGAGPQTAEDGPGRPITAMILDQQMPVFTGLQVMQQVQALFKSRKDLVCPLFFFSTAFATEEFRAEALRLGACEVFDKPMSKENFLSILEQTIDNVD